MKTKKFPLLVVMLAALCMIGCEPKEVEGDSVKEITLTKPFELAVGSLRTIIAKISPETALDKSLTWSTSAEAVATVDSEGVVTGVGIGTAVITATAVNGIKNTCEVTVVESQIFLEELKFKQDTIVIDMGKTLTYDFAKEIQMIPENANANTTIKWHIAAYSGSIEIDEVTGLAKMIKSTGKECAQVVASAGSVADTCYVEVNDITSPVVGDFYYSDGTFSTELDLKKECIGVVFCPKKYILDGVLLEKSLVVGFDITEGLAWSLDSTVTNTNNLVNGWKNVEILKGLDNTLANYPAAKWCDDKSGDWYLPAEREWYKLSLEQIVVNASFQLLIDAKVLTSDQVVMIGDNKEQISDKLAYWTSTEGFHVDYKYWLRSHALYFKPTQYAYWYTDKTKPKNGDMKIYVRAIMAF